MMTDEKKQEVIQTQERITSLRKAIIALQSGDNGVIPEWLDDAALEFRSQLARFEQNVERYIKYRI